jgi:threonine 3-dehydrogenase
MADKRPILITGGTGFIGSYLAMDLMERGEDVVLFDRTPDLRRIEGFKDRYEKVKNRLTFVQGDLSLLPHVMEVFDEHPPKSVYHLGALLSAGAEANPTMGFQVDLVGTWHVLEAARMQRQAKKGDSPIKVLFPSTIASFGEHIPKELKEKVPNEASQFPTTMYGTSKVASERLGEYYHRRGWVNFRGVRFPAVIGASRGPGGTTVYSTLMVEQPALGNTYTVYVKPDLRLAILYVKDAVKALRELHDVDEKKLGSSDQPKSTRRIFNIGSITGPDGQRPPTAEEIAQAVNGALGEDRVKFDPDPKMDATVRGFGILDDSKARQEWQWSGGDFRDLNKTIKDFIEEIKKYPGRLQRIELFGG